MFIASEFPKLSQLTLDEIHRINRARIALLLQKLPAEIDQQAFTDIEDLLAVYRHDNPPPDKVKTKPKTRRPKP